MNDKNLISALFVQQRIQIMHIAKHHDEFSDAYLYAWESGVYPLLSDTDGSVPAMPHEPYQDLFIISKEKGEYLLKRLDDAWMNKETLTFYSLEDELKINNRSGNQWSRSDLLHLCRYFYLTDLFDDIFWKTIITPMECPSEAYSITNKFDRENDIYFM